MNRSFDKDRNVRLHGKADEERAWAAVMALSGGARWVTLDEIGDFLRMRQIEAEREHFAQDAAATRYALPKSVVKWPRGWEDATIARAVSLAMDHQTIEHRHRQTDGARINEFRGVPQPAHDLWTYENTKVPVPEGGFPTPIQKAS